MFALETPPAGLPFTAKSSLQALLKSRGAVSETKGNGWIPMKDKAFVQSFLSTNEDCNTFTPAHRNNTAIFPLPDSDQNGDQNGDFSYSQKLFHIDDGNLYSIFSPLQGRSYGMKPSFLRKQKCTVQECHGRGRKIHRKGLKFHNFLPSESVTSEKDNDFHDNRWKVHSECKLREEHGTKQIMVSNWFQNIKHANDESASLKEESQVQPVNFVTGCMEGSNVATSVKAEQDIDDPYSFPANHESIEEFNSREMPSIGNSFSYNSVSSSDNKNSFLNNLLHSVSKPQSVSVSESIGKHGLQDDVSFACQKRRRKPDQTRRIVPYTKYLSLMEESDSSPLDLSVHANGEEGISKGEDQNQNSFLSLQAVETGENQAQPLSEYESNKFLKRALERIGPLDEQVVDPQSATNCFPNVAAYLCLSPQEQMLPPDLRQCVVDNSHSNTINERLSTSSKASTSNHRQFEVTPLPHRSSSNSITKSKARRKSQRSVIKQKLEDTFRQNGFLVKTKQVSDGEATFCKFRQLRKYTRYYLKSWQQHLPDEVHKMWKGFLPPKTVLPPVAGSPCSPMDDPT